MLLCDVSRLNLTNTHFHNDANIDAYISTAKRLVLRERCELEQLINYVLPQLEIVESWMLDASSTLDPETSSGCQFAFLSQLDAPNIKSIVVRYSSSRSDLGEFSKFTKLETLEVSGDVKTLKGIASLPLKNLVLPFSNAGDFGELPPGIERIVFERNTKQIRIDFNDSILTSIKEISLPMAKVLYSNSLEKMGKLQVLNVANSPNFDSIEGIQPSIIHLNLSRSVELTSLLPFYNLRNLEHLNMFSFVSLDTLAFLEKNTKLKHLDLGRNNEITDLEPLRNLKNLEHLNLWANSKITDFSPIFGLKNLKYLAFKAYKYETREAVVEFLSKMIEE